jgi:hypothetical protein
MTKRFEEPVRVLFHLDGGFTKVILERTIEIGLAYGGTEWDVPTEKIPVYLRKIGSRFVVATDGYTYNDIEVFEI